MGEIGIVTPTLLGSIVTINPSSFINRDQGCKHEIPTYINFRMFKQHFLLSDSTLISTDLPAVKPSPVEIWVISAVIIFTLIIICLVFLSIKQKGMAYQYS